MRASTGLLRCLFLLCAFLCLPAIPLHAAKTKTPPKPKDKVFVNDACAFTIIFPPDWDIKVQEDYMGVTGVSKPEGDADHFIENARLVAAVVDPQTSPEQAYQEFMVPLKQDVQEYTEIGVMDAALSGVPAKLLIYTYREGDNVLQAISAVTAVHGFSYAVTCTSLQETFDRFNPVFSKIIQGVKLPAPKPNNVKKLMHGFYVETPANWVEKEINENQFADWIMACPQKGKPDTLGAVAVITTAQLDNNMTIDELVQMAIQAGGGGLSSFKVVQSFDTTLRGIPAHKVIFAFSMYDMQFKCLGYYVKKDLQVSSILCFCPVNLFPTYQATFERLGNSFYIMGTVTR